MARLKYYLEKQPDKAGKHHIKVSLSHNGTSARFSTGVFVKPEYWHEGDAEVEPHVKRTLASHKTLNDTLRSHFDRIEEQVMALSQENKLSSFKTATQIKSHIEDAVYGRNPITFNEYFGQHIGKYTRESTASSFRTTLNRIESFSQGRELRFEDITVKWLDDFAYSMKDISVNARAVYLRNVRAVFKSALRNDIAEAKDPFMKFRIKTEVTAKRSLTIEQLRELRDYDCEKHQVIYRDMFMLIFYLRGINIVDLCNLKEIRNGRIEYARAKTGKLYSVKVEPEALAIIERYRGKGYLLNILDRYSDYRQFRKQMNRNLGQIGEMERKGRGGKKERTPLLPEITSYWARHSVATIAANLDVPKETISAMLGHGGNTVTDIYIDFDQKKADDANRKVIDAVNNPVFRED